MVLGILAGIGLATAASILAPKVAEWLSGEAPALHDKPLYEEMHKKTYTKAREYARTKLEQNIEKTPGIVDNIVQFIPGVGQFTTADQYKKLVKEYYTNIGYDPYWSKRLSRAAEAQYKIGGIWDTVGTIGIESTAEKIGAKTVGKLTARELAKTGARQLTKAQAAKLITKTALPGLAIAGFYEGSAETTKSLLSRDKEIDPVEIVKGGAFGAATAGLIGTGVARWSITRPMTSKGLLTFARIIDPYEYPGDIIGGIGSKGIRLPIITATPSTTTSSDSTGKGKKLNKLNKKKILDLINVQRKRVGLPVLTSIPSSTSTSTATDTPSDTPTPTDTPSDVPSPVDNPTDNPDPGTPDPVPDPTPPDPIPPNDPVPVSTPTPIPATTSIPIVTPLMRVTPPIWPLPGQGSQEERIIGRVSGKRKYYDERLAALDVLRGL